MNPPSRKSLGGYTLIELLIILSIIGILASTAMIGFASAKQKAFESRSEGELELIATGLEHYLNDYGEYPADTNRNLPPGLEEYLRPGVWPLGPWPGSVYDWDNWIADGQQVYQISLRFCRASNECSYPKLKWAKNFDYWSSVYYCIEGPCRSHGSFPANYPGYCVNCLKDD